MKDPRPSESSNKLVSAVCEELIVEMIFRRDTLTTAFVTGGPGRETEIRADITIGSAVYRPVSAYNNLIKHRAVLLPSVPIEYGDLETLLVEIGDYVRHYVALPEHAVPLVTAYVLLTWVYDAFNELPYLRFRGDYGTGKTRALLIVGSICYKAFFASGASTVSPIFHTLDLFKGTLIFDEADFRFTDEKAELVKILNNGNAKGFPVLRTQITPKKEFDPRAFSIFGPKIVGMRRSYADKALESRFLTIEMEPGHADGVPINLPDRQKDEAAQLRDKLLMFRLRERLSILLDPSLADPTLEPRVNQIVLPLLSIPIGEAMRDAIRYSVSALQEAALEDRSSSTEGEVLTILYRMVSSGDAIVALSEIAKSFAEQFGREYERPITSRWIGTIVRRLGFVTYKRNGVFVLRQGQSGRLRSLVTRYGIHDEGTRELGS
jgi:hypothetical protein